jgi:RNA polymerase sigma-70 factor (ECF subfamily)
MSASNIQHQHDFLLLQRLKEGDDAAFREFVRVNERRLFAFAMQLSGNREDAEDLVQEAFIKAHGMIASFRGESALYTWLHRIVVNLYIDFTRSGRYRTMTAWDDERDNDTETAYLHSPQPSPEARTNAALQQEHLERALQHLSPQQRTVFVLRYFQEFSLEEIAQELGVTVGTVKTQIFRAVKELRERLTFYGFDYKP